MQPFCTRLKHVPKYSEQANSWQKQEEEKTKEDFIRFILTQYTIKHFK